MSTTVEVHQSMFQFGFWQSKKMFDTKNPETSWFDGVQIRCSCKSWPMRCAGGIPSMPHRLPEEQTPAILAAGSVEKVRGNAGQTGSQDHTY